MHIKTHTQTYIRKCGSSKQQTNKTSITVVTYIF